MNISALVLAAGQSTRMGRPKMVLPWGEGTVIGQVILTLAQSGIDDILVVTGGARQAVEQALHDVPRKSGVVLRSIYNPMYAQGEMLSSFQVGLGGLGETVQAALVALGDQPLMERQVIRAVIEAYTASRSPLVVPSYRMRRGHPWLIDRSCWQAALSVQPPRTLRDFLQAQAEKIHYVSVETDSIFQDLDTPDDYKRFRPVGPDLVNGIN